MEAWNYVKDRTRRLSARYLLHLKASILSPTSPMTPSPVNVLFEDANRPIDMDLGHVKLKYQDKLWTQGIYVTA